MNKSVSFCMDSVCIAVRHLANNGEAKWHVGILVRVFWVWVILRHTKCLSIQCPLLLILASFSLSTLTRDPSPRLAQGLITARHCSETVRAGRGDRLADKLNEAGEKDGSGSRGREEENTLKGKVIRRQEEEKTIESDKETEEEWEERARKGRRNKNNILQR